MIKTVKNLMNTLRNKLRSVWANLRAQVKDPNPETLAGIVLGTSWGHILSSAYVGVVALIAGLPIMALIMFAFAGFELWQNYHLSRHFHQVLSAELFAMTLLNSRPLQVVNV